MGLSTTMIVEIAERLLGRIFENSNIQKITELLERAAGLDEVVRSIDKKLDEIIKATAKSGIKSKN